MNEKDQLGLIIALISVIGGLCIPILYIVFTTKGENQRKLATLEAKNRERLLLIEKGMNPNLLDKKIEKKTSNGPLLWGLLLAGIGLGILSGYIISQRTGTNENIMTNSMALILGGLALLIYYVYSKKERKKAA